MNYMVMVVVLLYLCKADAMAVGATEAYHNAMEFDQAEIIKNIIRDLGEIRNVDLVPAKHFKVPKIKESCHCFAKDLDHFIYEMNKTSLKDSLKHVLQTLQMNAKHLGEHYLDKEVCKSDRNQFRPMKNAINHYIHFLQKMFQSIVPGR